MIPWIGSSSTFYDAVQALKKHPEPTLDFSSHILQIIPSESVNEPHQSTPHLQERFAKLHKNPLVFEPMKIEDEFRMNPEPLEALFADCEMDDEFPIKWTNDLYWLSQMPRDPFFSYGIEDHLPSLKEIEQEWLDVGSS